MRALSVVLLACLGFGAVPALGQDGKEALLGAWTVTEAVVAPWSGDAGAGSARQASRLLNSVVVFGPRVITARDPQLTCGSVRYEATRLPADALFQSALPEFARDATLRSLGLPEGEVAGVDVGCSTGLYSYHFKDPLTVLLGFNNRIYVLRRKSTRSAAR
jgi:hypothetical protein